MKIPSLSYLAEAFEGVLRRFPLPMLAAFTGTLATMLQLELEFRDGPTQDLLVRTLLSAALALPLLLSAAILSESRQWAGLNKWLPSLLALAVVAVYFFTLPENITETGLPTPMRFLGLNLVAHLMVAYLPYLGSGSIEDFWEYNKRLFGNFFIGAFYSTVIFLGLAAAILAVNELFNLNVDGKVYGHLFIFIAGVINSSYFLANFPRQYQGIAEEGAAYNAAFKNLSKFILIPIVGIYFLILYAYGVKILATWKLPEGWVSSLVLGFSGAGILTYLLNFMLIKYDDSSLVSGFRRWFFFVLAPLVALLFVAIGRRLNDYGFTEERYVVLALGIWLAVLCVYFILSKRDNIKFIPISLSVLALLAVLGPLSAFKVSERSQVGQLKSLLEKHGMFVDGKLAPAKDTLPAEVASNIRSKFEYLRDMEHFGSVAGWFVNPPKGDRPDWMAVDSLLNALNFQAGTTKYGETCYLHFDNNLDNGLNISGYDKMFRVYLDAGSTDKGWQFSDDQHWLTYTQDSITDRFNLLPYVEELQTRLDCDPNKAIPSDAFAQLKGEKFEIQLVVETMNYQREEKKVGNMNAVILLKPRR